jgi:hypothetical protein
VWCIKIPCMSALAKAAMKGQELSDEDDPAACRNEVVSLRLESLSFEQTAFTLYTLHPALHSTSCF